MGHTALDRLGLAWYRGRVDDSADSTLALAAPIRYKQNMPYRTLVRLAATLVIAAVAPTALATAPSRIMLNEKEYFEGPGFSFLVFHNNYQIGYQGGLQMIENGERVLDSGDLMLVPKPGQQGATPRVLRRVVDRANATATVWGDLGDLGTYRLICRTDGARILVTLALDKPIDWSRFEQAGFRIALYPGMYVDKSYQADGAGGVFPHQ